MKDNKKPGISSSKHKRRKQALSTIRSIFVSSEENLDEIPDLSNAFRLVYKEKIHKYFGVDEDLTNFQIRSREDGLDIVAMELREMDRDSCRGYVIVGDEGYQEQLKIMKKIYFETYANLTITKEFDNSVDRAGFYWQGTNKE